MLSGVTPGHGLVVLLVASILVGSARLPKFGRSLASLRGEFRAGRRDHAAARLR